MVTNRNTEYEENLYCEGDWSALEQDTQMGCRVSLPGDVQNSLRHDPALGESFSGSWAR